MKLKIAVILITYNQKEYVKFALKGILDQTRRPDEVIIADDGSFDGTQNEINQFVVENNLEDKWLLLLSKHNRGINKNINDAVKNASSDILILMAGDDISYPIRCQHTERTFLKFPEYSAVLGSGERIDETGNSIGEINEIDGHVISDLTSIVKRGYCGILPVGLSFRREVLANCGGLPLDVPNEDDQTVYRSILYGGILCSSVKVYKYRIHSKSASSWIRDSNYKKFLSEYQNHIKERSNQLRHWRSATLQANNPSKVYLINLIDLKLCAYNSYSERFKGFIQYLRWIKVSMTLSPKEFFSLHLGPTIYFGAKLFRNKIKSYL